MTENTWRNNTMVFMWMLESMCRVFSGSFRRTQARWKLCAEKKTVGLEVKAGFC